MKKVSSIIFTTFFVVFILGNNVSADSVSENTSKDIVFKKDNFIDLDKFIKDIGDPSLEKLSDVEKLEFYNNLLPGEVLEYDKTEEKTFILSPDGDLIELESTNIKGFEPFSTIPSTRLKVSHAIYNSLVNGKKGKRVTLQYAWGGTRTFDPGTKGHKVGIAIPSGWNITPQSYTCEERKSGNGTTWAVGGNCNGRTYELNYYGAVWSLTQTTKVHHKGTNSLRMERTSSSAQNKVIGTYVKDKGNSISTSWSIGWGPASVSISGNKATEKVSWDTSFTY